MDKKTEALKLAEDALKRVRTQDMELVQLSMIALVAIREALASEAIEKPAPGRAHYEDGDVFERISAMKKQPAQRTWVGLTDDEILYCVELENPKAIAEEVEAKLRERNT